MGTMTAPSATVAKTKKPTARSLTRFLPTLVLLAILGVAGYYLLNYFRGGVGTVPVFIGEVQTDTVKKGLLRVTVNDDGNVESSANVDLRCEVEDGSQILWIIPQGTEVKTGDLLVRFNSATIEEEITQQTIIYERANADMIRAETEFAVAGIAVKEYEEGTFVKELQIAEANIKIAQENLRSSENLLGHNERMFRKGYINRLQLETTQFAVERNKLDLAAMQTTRDVLVEFTKPKMLKELVSQREAAQANVLAMKAAADLEKTKLDRLKVQLAKCTIRAPQDGMVIYSNDRGRSFRDGAATIEEGATVREMQSIIQLPDLSKMQVNSLVHETKIDKIRAGMPATIRIRGKEMPGHVTLINNQPEPGNWFSSEVKEYAVKVAIDGADAGVLLKPGMTAEVEILVREIPDALQIPLLGVVQEGIENVSYVMTKESYERRPIQLGAASTSFVEVLNGLEKGEQVILNPRACVAEARHRAEQAALKMQKDMRKRARESQSADPGANHEAGAQAKSASSENKATANVKKEIATDRSGGGDSPAAEAAHDKSAPDETAPAADHAEPATKKSSQ